jgi:hypothetical protein
MVIEKVFKVLEDGCVMHLETGAIQWPSKNQRGQKYFVLDGKFYLQRNLLKMRNENASKGVQTA